MGKNGEVILTMGWTIYVVKDWVEIGPFKYGKTVEFTNMSYGGYADLARLLEANNSDIKIFIVPLSEASKVPNPKFWDEIIVEKKWLEEHHKRQIREAIKLLNMIYEGTLDLSPLGERAGTEYVESWLLFCLRAALNGWLVLREE